MEIELREIRNDSENKFKVIASCSECDEQMAETEIMTGKELSNRWISIVMGGALSIGRCPKCKYSTFSDCNLAYETKIVNAQ